MGTRAIFAVQLDNGKYLGGWQWWDANIPPSELNRRLSTIKEVDTLLAIGEWESLMSKHEKEDFIKFRRKNEMPEPIFTKVGKYYVHLDDYKTKHKRPSNGFCAPKVYASIKEMQGQDINFVYVFDTKTCRWEKYR